MTLVMSVVKSSPDRLAGWSDLSLLTQMTGGL